MNIFDKRPLSLILCIMLGGFVLFSVSNTAFRIAIIATGVCIIILSLILYRQQFSFKRLTFVCAAALLCSSLLSFLYFDCYYLAYTHVDAPVEFTGDVEYTETSYGRKQITVNCNEISNTNLSSCKILLLLPMDEAENISVGSEIVFTGTPTAFSDEANTYYLSRGYSACVNDAKDVVIIAQNDPSLEYYISSYRNSLCRQLILNTDENSGGLLSALLLGEKQYLDDEINLSFKRTGLSHVLALSGLHLSILAMCMDKMLTLLRLKKKPRKIIEITVVLAYMIFTGLPVSVVRAGIMLIISYSLFLISHKGDSITNLYMAVAIIVMIEPYAVFDISLWLSALSTFGILLISEWMQKFHSHTESIKTFASVFKNLLISLIYSLSAIGATLAIITFAFGRISIIAPISNIAFTLPIEIFMYIGTSVMFLGNFLGIGTLCSWIGNAILSAIDSVSSINWIYNSAEHPVTEVLVIIFTVLFFAFSIIKISKKRIAVLCLMTILLSVFISSLAFGIVSKNNLHFDYIATKSNEMIIMQSNRETTVLDVSTPTASNTWDNIDIVSDMNITDIQNYIFASYSKIIKNSAKIVSGNIKTDKIYIPLPQNAEEDDLYRFILDEFEDSKTEIITYTTDKFITCGDFSIFPAYRSPEENKTAVTILYEDQFYTYLSSGMLEDDTKNVALGIMDGCHTLILGCHGNSYYNYDFIYKVNELKTLIVSSKNVNLTSETLTFYSGTEIYFHPERVSLIR